MATTFDLLSQDLAAVVETAGKSIVRVEGRPRLPATGIVWAADGVIVTAHHVLEVEDNLRLGLADGGATDATLVGRDPTTDLAVLRVQARGLEAPAWGDSTALRVGHLVLALGRPGRTVQASLGLINAIGGEWRTPGGGLVEQFIQTGVTMYPGFSGGPLVNAAGQVVGLNTSGLVRGMQPALPVATVRRVVEALLVHGRVRRGYLGVSAQPVRLPAAVGEQLGQEIGLLISAVEADSPAERAGLLLGDVLAALAGERIQTMDDLLAALSGDRVNTSVPARVVRGGKVNDIPVVIGERQ